MARSTVPPRGGDKPIRDALTLALNREAIGSDGKPTRQLNLVAEKFVEIALGGDLHAIRDIFDRLYGKPAQAIVGAHGGPVETYDMVALAKLSDDDLDKLIAIRDQLAGPDGPEGGKRKTRG